VALGVAVGAALLAAAWDTTPLLLWASGLALIAGAASWWMGTLRTGIEVELAFEPARIFLGEPATLVLRVVNRRRLPLPVVRVSVPLPPGLGAEQEPDPTAFMGHRRRFPVAARSEVEMQLPVFPRERGEYWVEGVTVELSDPFELAPVRRELGASRPLLVIPRVRGRGRVAIARSLPFGSPAAAAHLFEDREHMAGVRPYEPGDPMHHVHWRASAHAGALQTKRFQPTRSAEVLLAIDLSAGEPFWHGVDVGAAESAIGCAASVAREAVHAGWRTGLVANTHLRRGRGPLRVRPGAAVGHEAALFAALARMPNQPTNDLAPVLREAGRALPRRASVVVVSGEPGRALTHEMETLRRRGLDVTLLDPGVTA
jgi:uncharacterized protein (DUF58 family)